MVATAAAPLVVGRLKKCKAGPGRRMAGMRGQRPSGSGRMGDGCVALPWVSGWPRDRRTSTARVSRGGGVKRSSARSEDWPTGHAGDGALPGDPGRRWCKSTWPFPEPHGHPAAALQHRQHAASRPGLRPFPCPFLRPFQHPVQRAVPHPRTPWVCANTLAQRPACQAAGDRFRMRRMAQVRKWAAVFRCGQVCARPHRAAPGQGGATVGLAPWPHRWRTPSNKPRALARRRQVSRRSGQPAAHQACGAPGDAQGACHGLGLPQPAVATARWQRIAPRRPAAEGLQ